MRHISVLKEELINNLEINEGKKVLDVTLGAGGHALEVIKKLGKSGTLVCLDVDIKAIKNFEERLQEINFKKENLVWKKQNLSVYLFQSNFKKFDQVLKKLNIQKLDAIYADLGFSTDQLDYIDGMSFLEDSPLDMRMDTSLQVTAADLLNGLYRKELIRLFESLADIRFSNRLANEIVNTRKTKPFITTKDLTALVRKIVPFGKRKGTNKHPEAKVFQALRIAVNDELSSLHSFLPLAFEHLNQGGRLAVISFHSGEDRIVKRFCKEEVKIKEASFIKELVIPTSAEIEKNPNCRSAKLRIIKK